MKKLNWTNIRLSLMFLVVLFLFSFASKRNSSRKLTKSVVVFVGDTPPFVKQEVVSKLLIENNEEAKNIERDELNLCKIEKKLNSQEMIEKSDVFVSIDGVLKAVVKQKTPMARVFDTDGSYYIDYKGSRMPMSSNFTARVPLVSGDISKINSKEFADFFRLIYDDDFLKKNIIAVKIKDDGGLKLFNRDFDYQIDFGKTVRMNAKFNNYKAFFQKAVQNKLLSNYKNIDLRFEQQVVCTKK